MKEVKIDAPAVRSLSPVQKKIKQLLEEGKTESQICSRLHICSAELEEQVCAIYEKGHEIMKPKITQEKIDRIRELWMTGEYKQKEIALIVGTSRTAVCRYVTLLKAEQVEATQPSYTEPFTPDFSDMVKKEVPEEVADKLKAVGEATRLPVSYTYSEGADEEEDIYAYDGSMPPEDFQKRIKLAQKEAPASVAADTDADKAEEVTPPADKSISPEREKVKGAVIPDAVRQMIYDKSQEINAEALRLSNAALELQRRARELFDKVGIAQQYLIRNGGFEDEND